MIPSAQDVKDYSAAKGVSLPAAHNALQRSLLVAEVQAATSLEALKAVMIKILDRI